MKKIILAVSAACISVSTAITALAADVTLYSLDKRELTVSESEVEIYTKEGMGWFKEKPVDMYSEDGRTITVQADKVEDYKKVGWYLTNPTAAPDADDTASSNKTDKVTITLPDGPTISVPSYQLETYKSLGWVESSESVSGTVTVYNSEGTEKQIDRSQLSKYINAGWKQKNSESTQGNTSTESVTVYSADGLTKTILKSDVEKSKAQGWYPALDEAIYAYAAFGSGSDDLGATQLLENKQYELAFEKVENALKKLEGTDSEYVSMLYYLRTVVNDTWRVATNCPIGLITYNFQNDNDYRYIIFEYRNISNSRIKSYRIDFDVCDASGNILEQNNVSYNVGNLDVKPCEAKKTAWVVDKGAILIKNIKVLEVSFSDGTVWKAEGVQ